MLTTLSTLPAPLDFQPMVSFEDRLERLEALAQAPFQAGDDETGPYRMWLFEHDGVPFIVSIDTVPRAAWFSLHMDPTVTCDASGQVEDVLEALGVVASAVRWRNATWLHQPPAMSEAV